MRLPDFLIIGAAKSGTTTLYKYLEQHPQIYLSPEKEPQFFAVDEKYARGMEWYSSLFEGAQPQQICGEASTDYAKLPRYPETAERIAKAIPNVKMIYVMRHPVERAYSYYVHLCRGQKITESFEEHIQRTSICLDASFYIKQIKHFQQFFPRESFLFLLMEDVIKQPVPTLKKVCRFLEVDEEVNLFQGTQVTANGGKNYFEDTIRAKITAPLRAIPGVETVKEALPQQWRDTAYGILQKSFYGKGVKEEYKALPMKPETRQMLLKKFSSYNQQLADFLDRDLSHWEV